MPRRLSTTRHEPPEAKNRGKELIAVPTAEPCRLLASIDRQDVHAKRLHMTGNPECWHQPGLCRPTKLALEEAQRYRPVSRILRSTLCNDE